jgi:hypothetical protein
MSELSKKYGIPDSAVKALIKDGWLSCSVARYEEVYYHYKSNLHYGNSKAIRIASDNTGYSESMIYHIISKFK